MAADAARVQEGGALVFDCARHTAAGAFPQIAKRRACLPAVLLAASLAGCSVAVPNAAPTALARGDDGPTGSIPKKAPETISRALDAEDWRRAAAAMGTALDPQGSGASVNWDNPQSGAKGSFTPVGQPYPLDGKVCRAFLADLTTKDQQERLQGAACREKSSDWALQDVRPWKKG
jgi:surface antigen